MVSILLPVSNTEDPKLIDWCIKSLAKQAYKDFEVLIVTSKDSAKKISSITKKYSFVKILEKDLNKTAARNFAAKNAKGEYLYHLDADMALTPRVLSECVKKAEEGAEAIIIQGEEEPQPHLISKCRTLERRLLRDSRAVGAPLFLKKSLFEEAGGYDENLDPLDDWDLRLTLKEMGIEFKRIQAPILIRESTDLKTVLKRKYERGRVFSIFIEKHPYSPQLNPRRRLEDYFRNWKKLVKSPFISLCLFFLKLGDISAFFWGALHPTKPKNRYVLPKVAEEYEQKRLGSNFGRYKHFAELNSLSKLLPKKDWQILEVGCGTGRITKEFVKRGYKVFPIDSSAAMLAQYRQKPGLSKPQLANATHLPFPDKSFHTAISIRVIWHLLSSNERENMLAEMARVSSSFVILDITNKKRWPKIYLNLQRHKTYFFTWKEFVNLSKKYSLRIEEKIPLDTLTPFWLNFIPQRLAMTLFPLIYRADLLLAKLIPPGRYLLKLKPRLLFPKNSLVA